MADFLLRAPKGGVYDPLPSQWEFHAAEEKYRAYIGGMGAGKTLANCVEALHMAMSYPGSEGLIGRKTYGELELTTWATLRKIVPDALVKSEVCSSQKVMMELYAPGGKVSIIHGLNLSNWKKITSMNLDWFGVDELTELESVEVWGQLEGRLRGDVGPHRGWGSGTPAGHDWVWRLFVKQALPGYRVVKAKTSQNFHNPIGYEQGMRRRGSLEWNKRFLDAEFSVWEGQILHAWNEGVHVIPRFPIPDHWPRFLAIDPGMADPTAALMFATDENGFIFVTDEFYQTGLTIDEQAAGILRMVGDVRLEWAVIDPAVRVRVETTGKTRLQMYRDAGLPVMEANNAVDDSIAWIQKALHVDPNRRHPLTGKLGAPGVFVFANCGHLREEIPGWVWSKNGKKPKDGNDHAIAAWRYGMMRRPHAAEPKGERRMNPLWESFRKQLSREMAEEPLIGAGPGGVWGTRGGSAEPSLFSGMTAREYAELRG